MQSESALGLILNTPEAVADRIEAAGCRIHRKSDDVYSLTGKRAGEFLVDLRERKKAILAAWIDGGAGRYGAAPPDSLKVDFMAGASLRSCLKRKLVAHVIGQGNDAMKWAFNTSARQWHASGAEADGAFNFEVAAAYVLVSWQIWRRVDESYRSVQSFLETFDNHVRK